MPDEEKCPDCGEEKHKFWWDCPKNDEAPEFILKGNGWPGKGEVKE